RGYTRRELLQPHSWGFPRSGVGPSLTAGEPWSRGMSMVNTRIAKIITPTMVVLAAGTLQGVTEGMEFIIYELTEPILDPDTKEDLGQLELHKGRVRVINAEEKASQAITFRK